MMWDCTVLCDVVSLCAFSDCGNSGLRCRLLPCLAKIASGRTATVKVQRSAYISRIHNVSSVSLSKTVLETHDSFSSEQRIIVEERDTPETLNKL